MNNDDLITLLADTISRAREFLGNEKEAAKELFAEQGLPFDEDICFRAF